MLSKVMGTVLWIDQNTFASNLIEKVFKKKALPFYTLKVPRDFAYLVDDLKPSVIVLDGETARVHLEAFKAEYSSSISMQKTPFILINPSQEFAFLKSIGEIKKPIDPFAIPDMIQKILGNLS